MFDAHYTNTNVKTEVSIMLKKSIQADKRKCAKRVVLANFGGFIPIQRVPLDTK